MLSQQMLFSDPPDHTRLRGLANRAFTPRVVEAMRQRIPQGAGIAGWALFAFWLHGLLIGSIVASTLPTPITFSRGAARCIAMFGSVRQRISSGQG